MTKFPLGLVIVMASPVWAVHGTNVARMTTAAIKVVLNDFIIVLIYLSVLSSTTGAKIYHLCDGCNSLPSSD
jgi:hypothetical protein